MTTPDERRRTLVQAGAFLKELRGNQSLPDAVRQEHIDCCATTRACGRSNISPTLPKAFRAGARWSRSTILAGFGATHMGCIRVDNSQTP